MSEQGYITRILARIRAFTKRQWEGAQGDGLRRDMEELDRLTFDAAQGQAYQVEEKKAYLARLAGKWASGKPNLQQAQALNEAAEAINRRTEARLKEDAYELHLRQETANTITAEAQARSADAKAVRDRIAASREALEFADELTQRGLIVDTTRLLTKGEVLILKNPAVECDLPALEGGDE